MSVAATKQIVIIGGGIIGCTAAYYLSRLRSSSGYQITLLEASKNGVAQGASGKAGGLVAKWAYPKELVNVSFKEHVRLAEELGGEGRWGWRYVHCGSWEGRGEYSKRQVDDAEAVPGSKPEEMQETSLEKTLGLVDGSSGGGAVKQQHKKKMAGFPSDLGTWIPEHLTESYSPMAPEGRTAQVYPYEFTESMMHLAQENGVKLVTGAKATSILIDHSKAGKPKVEGVVYQDVSTGESTTLPASYIILAAGAWSPHILSSLPISGTRAHSIVFQPSGVVISPYVLFTEITLPPVSESTAETEASPEIYARPNNQVYACGPGDRARLPSTVDEVQVDDAACESIRKHVSSISPVLRESKLVKRQACFLPVVSIGGGPIVGEAGKIAKGLIIATGHTCWGICNAPGTAKAIAELIEYGEIQCANLRKLQPSMFI